MQKLRQLAVGIFGATSALFLMASGAEAQSNWVPKPIADLLTGDVLRTATNRTRVFFVLLIGALLLVVIFTIITNLIKFSREDTEIKEAASMMQRQLVAVAGVFVAVMGLAIVFVFFGQRIIFPEEICIDAPDSIGCFACNQIERAEDRADLICSICNDNRTYNFTGNMNATQLTNPDDANCSTDLDAFATTPGGNVSDSEGRDILETQFGDNAELEGYFR